MNTRRFAFIVFGLWLAVILGVTIRGVASPHRNSVFDVFRDAGHHWVAGHPLYSQVGKYLYSPLAAAFFAPFALISDQLASGLWRLGTGLVYLAAIFFWFAGRYEPVIRRIVPGSEAKSAPSQDERERIPIVLTLLLLLPLSIGNLNNGQASPMIIALLIFGCMAFMDARWSLAAACFSFAAFFKIYPLAIGLLLMVIEPRKMGWRLLLGLVMFGWLSLVLQQPSYVFDQYQSWLQSLAADQRRISTDLGSWRDAWLLLRIIRIPITVSAYAVIQALAALAAAYVCWRRGKVWDRAAVTWFAFTTGCLWITLFGPSTELSTYIFLAPAVASICAWAVWPMILGQKPRPVFQFIPVIAYLLLLLAEALNAWVPVIRQNNYPHAIQPVGALLFLVFIVSWRPLTSPDSEPAVSPAK